MRCLMLALFTSCLVAVEPTTEEPPTFTVGDLAVVAPYARAMPPGAVASAVFFTVRNDGAVDDALVSASSTACEVVELHTHVVENGVARMRQVPRIAVPAGGVAELRPGGDHVMLIGLHGDLAAGDLVTVDLVFEHAGTVQVTTTARPVKRPGRGRHGGHGQPGHH